MHTLYVFEQYRTIMNTISTLKLDQVNDSKFTERFLCGNLVNEWDM